ncbi:MAG: hypothetical protein P8N51_08055 [Pseudomonadales bacterium]|jgi:hypothetical protein|nr:hypothetical protein [Pseudomonadales bacterium]MDG1444252.1 hypothetical protein [Pseudomonadales bacterium]
MRSILIYFLQICLLRVGPERVPSNTRVVASIFGLYFVIAMVSLIFTRPDIALAIKALIIIIGFAIEAGLIYALLLFKSMSQRYLSTLGALLGTNALLLISLMPLEALAYSLEEGLVVDILITLENIIFFWWLLIVGFLLHRSAGISILQGTMIAFLIELVVVISTNPLIS